MIPVIINNRDLLTWPKAMVERISKYEGVGDIWIVDNNSSNMELKIWYRTAPCKVVEISDNLGHTAPWDCGLVKGLKAPFYVVTDSDMGLEDTPDDTLLHLLDREMTLNMGKIGLGLDYNRVPKESPYYQHMLNYEKPRWNGKMYDGVALGVAVDTTFALYSRQKYFIGGGSTYPPYTARHLPWEMTNEDYEKNEEFKYYIKHASNSSSFKWFLKK